MRYFKPSIESSFGVPRGTLSSVLKCTILLASLSLVLQGCFQPQIKTIMEDEAFEVGTCLHPLPSQDIVINNISNSLVNIGYLVSVQVPSNKVSIIAIKDHITGTVCFDVRSFAIFKDGGLTYTLELINNTGQLDRKRFITFREAINEAFERAYTVHK